LEAEAEAVKFQVSNLLVILVALVAQVAAETTLQVELEHQVKVIKVLQDHLQVQEVMQQAAAVVVPVVPVLLVDHMDLDIQRQV
jgi:hypothetical protein